jgi:hypothetical protein
LYRRIYLRFWIFTLPNLLCLRSGIIACDLRNKLLKLFIANYYHKLISLIFKSKIQSVWSFVHHFIFTFIFYQLLYFNLCFRRHLNSWIKIHILTPPTFRKQLVDRLIKSITNNNWSYPFLTNTWLPFYIKSAFGWANYFI